MSLSRRLEKLEAERKFQLWLGFERFLELLTDHQLEELALYWRFPESLPERSPFGVSRLEGLDKKSLMKLWKESERETTRLMREMSARTEEEHRFYLHHAHWPDQACDLASCHKSRNKQ